MIYEEVLRCLQAGDRPAARHTVLKWRPKGPDAYMHVLRGSLMAEVGDPSAAMPAFEQAIQTLRRQQRSRPGDPELISKEAWACVVANHVQEAAEFGWLVRGDVRRKGATDEKEEKEREDFDGRLNVLVARGYSAREELSSVLAKLNAEAVPPQVESSQLGGFDLGTTSSRRIIGGPTEFRNKVAASFAWLELMERVGLLPQTRNASFFADAMLQAAWWTRFADRSERAIGLLLRANRPDSLKPRDPFLPPHRTGWLGRYQVAQFGEDAATELASEFLLQIELEFDGTRPSSDSGSRAAFLLEAFGRLVIRVRSNSLLVEWGHRLLGLHRSVAFQAEPTAWESSSKAIGRLLEALPSHSQEPLLLQALRLPPVPAADLGVKFHDHQLQRWLEVSEIFQNFSTIGVSVDASPWRHVVDDLLFRLRAPESEEPIASTWRRLEALQGAGILTERDKADVGNILWGHVEPGRWPSIPNAHAIGTLNWPSPHHNAASRLLDRFLSHPLRPFSRGYMQYLPAHKRRSYHIGGIDATVGQIRYVLGKTQPSLSQMQGLIALVDEWIDVDAHDLLADVDDEEVRPSVQGIVAYLDQMLAECVRRLVPRKSSNDCINLIGLICAIDERLEGFRVERFQLHMELVKGGYSRPDSLQAIAKTIIPALRSPDAQLSRRAFRVAFDLLKDEHEAFQDVGRGVFNAVVACTFAETSLCLSHALNVLASLPGTSWHRYLDSSALWLLESALVALSDSVTYERARGVSRIADEDVPLVRFNVFRLAHAMVHIAEVQSKEATSWLESAAHDPLPEIRLERFKDAES